MKIACSVGVLGAVIVDDELQMHELECALKKHEDKLVAFSGILEQIVAELGFGEIVALIPMNVKVSPARLTAS